MKMRFKRIYIEISNVCNLNCSFCSKTNREAKFLSEEEFLHIINEVRPFSDFVYFHVKGEPLLHPSLPYFLRVCEENNVNVNITTNGTLLEEKADILLSSKALRQVNISVHSFSENEEEGYLERVICFARRASEKGIFVVLRLWNLTGERTTDEITKNSIKKIGEICPEIDLLEQMKIKRSVTLSPNLFVSFEQLFEWPTLSREYDCDGYCHGGRDQIAILSNGVVVPCCLDGDGVVNLGNIFTQPFEEIVNSKRLKAMYDGFTARRAVEELCRKCTFKSRFDKTFKT